MFKQTRILKGARLRLISGKFLFLVFCISMSSCSQQSTTESRSGTMVRGGEAPQQFNLRFDFDPSKDGKVSPNAERVFEPPILPRDTPWGVFPGVESKDNPYLRTCIEKVEAIKVEDTKLLNSVNVLSHEFAIGSASINSVLSLYESKYKPYEIQFYLPQSIANQFTHLRMVVGKQCTKQNPDNGYKAITFGRQVVQVESENLPVGLVFDAKGFKADSEIASGILSNSQLASQLIYDSSTTDVISSFKSYFLYGTLNNDSSDSKAQYREESSHLE